jgi:hypothetical protein
MQGTPLRPVGQLTDIESGPAEPQIGMGFLVSGGL